MNPENHILKQTMLALALATATVATAPNLAAAKQAVESTGYLPEFEATRPNIEVLEENLTRTGELADVLKRGNDELSEAIKQYRQDHTLESKDRIYVLLGELAGTTVEQVDDIMANKDKMKDGLAQILYKMGHIQTSLSEKKLRFTTHLDNTRELATATKDELRELARAIKKDLDNRSLRTEFRRKLFLLRSQDNRHKTYLAHQRLNEKFGKQVDMAQQFFQYLDGNMDQLMLNLAEQKEFLVMRVALLKDAAEMESWLRGEKESNVSAFAMMTKIGELSKALERFNAAADVLVEMNDIGTLIDSLPDAGDIFNIGPDGVTNTENFEDRYVEYFLDN